MVESKAPIPPTEEAPGRTRARRLAVQFVVSFGLGGIFLYWAFKDVELEETWSHLRNVDAPLVALSVGLWFLIQLVRALRWGILLSPFAKIRPWRLVNLTFVGYAATLALPFRLGEFVRPYLVRTEQGTGMTAALATVTTERALDGTLLSVLFFMVVTFAGHTVQPGLLFAAVAGLGIFLSAGVFLVLAVTRTDLAARIVRTLAGLVSKSIAERLVGMVYSFALGLQSFRSVSLMGGTLITTAVIWTLGGLSYWAALQASHIDLGVADSFVVMAIVAIGVMVPAAPGFLGSFQFAINIALVTVFGFEKNSATAAGLLIYFIQVAFTCLVGVLPILTGQVKFAAMRKPPDNEEQVP